MSDPRSDAATPRRGRHALAAPEPTAPQVRQFDPGACTTDPRLLDLPVPAPPRRRRPAASAPQGPADLVAAEPQSIATADIAAAVGRENGRPEPAEVRAVDAPPPLAARAVAWSLEGVVPALPAPALDTGAGRTIERPAPRRPVRARPSRSVWVAVGAVAVFCAAAASTLLPR